jgi:Domain of unknown function (DUF4340)
MKLSTTLLMVALVGALTFFVVRYESKMPDTTQLLKAKARPFTFDPKTVDTVLISGKDMELKLVRINGVWRITHPIKDRANADLLEKVLTTVSDLQWMETTARKDIKNSDWKRAGLNDASLELVMLSTGKEQARLKLGAAGTLLNTLFISTVDRKNEQQIHLARTPLGAICTKTVEDWRDVRVLRLGPEKVRRFVISAGDGVLEFTRNSSREWDVTKPLQTRASQERVSAVLNAMLNLEAKPGKTGAPPPAAASTSPVMKITFDVPDLPKPIELSLQPSEKPEEEPIVSVSDRPGLFRVPPKVATFWKLQPNHLRDQRVVRLDPEKATSLRLRSIAYPEIVLNREADTWMLTRHGVSAPANQDRVHQLFEGFNSAEVVDFPADAPKSLEVFGLHQPFLEVEWHEGQSGDTLRFGKGKDDGIYAARASAAFVYRINPQMLQYAPPDSLKWRDPTVINLSIFNVKRIITSVGAAPPTTLHYDASYAAWKGDIAGQDISARIDRAKADALLQKLVNLQAAEWTTERTAAYAALKNPTLTIQLLTADPNDPEAKTKPLTITLAPTVPNIDTAIYHGRINEEPDTFLINRDLYHHLAAPVIKGE